MRIQERAAAPSPAGVMNLHEPVPWPALEGRVNVDAEIDGVHIHVRDVAKPSAASRLQNARQKFRLLHLGAGNSDHGCDILQHKRRVDTLANRLDIARDDVDCLPRAGQRRKMADRDAPGAGEAKMLAPPGGIDAPDHPRELVEIGGINPFRTAD